MGRCKKVAHRAFDVVPLRVQILLVGRTADEGKMERNEAAATLLSPLIVWMLWIFHSPASLVATKLKRRGLLISEAYSDNVVMERE